MKEFDQVVGEGRGFGLAFAADQNGYPGPMHVLELKDRLRITGDQERAMQRVMDAMFAESWPAAARLLAAERQLRAIFAASAASETAVRAAVTDVERTRTEVRLIHLLAHLKTRDVLTVRAAPPLSRRPLGRPLRRPESGLVAQRPPRARPLTIRHRGEGAAPPRSKP